MDEIKKTHPTQAAKIKVGDLMAFVYWAKVKAITEGGVVLDVADVDKDMGVFHVRGKTLVERGFSATQHHETVKVTKTQAAELLVSSHNRPLTVTFLKQDGTERVLVGRLITAEPLLGRSLCEDLETTDKNRVRLVDHRSIISLVVDGVRYEVK